MNVDYRFTTPDDRSPFFSKRTVRVKFLQAYLLSGGSSGRLARGDAMIEMDFVDEMREVPQLC